jgi:hypothetical protein
MIATKEDIQKARELYDGLIAENNAIAQRMAELLPAVDEYQQLADRYIPPEQGRSPIFDAYYNLQQLLISHELGKECHRTERGAIKRGPAPPPKRLDTPADSGQD